MSVLDSYMKDLAELVNKDRGTANIAGVTEAAKIGRASCRERV